MWSERAIGTRGRQAIVSACRIVCMFG
jgi:hypothetical protein